MRDVLSKPRRRNQMKSCATDFTGQLTVDELEAAAKVIIQSTQRQVHGEENERSQEQAHQKRRCSETTPSKEGKSAQRSGSGIGRRTTQSRRTSESSYHGARKKHPLILPGSSRVARLIIEDTHRQVGHQGRDSRYAALRERFWVTKGNAAVRSCSESMRKMQTSPGTCLLPEDV